MKSYSQLRQDLNVISFYNNKNDMYFIDIGANDGKTLSNTYLLEKKYNWKGICSEPLPKAFQKLIKRRSATCDNNAVFKESGLSLEFSESDLLSGITNFIDKYEEAKKDNPIIVKTITLQSLLDNYKAPKIIQYFSLDTEGTELEILKSVDFSTYTFLYINLEHNYVEPRRSEIRTLLLNNRYLYKGQNSWDDDYIHESTVIGTYYHQHDYTKPIIIKRKNDNKFSVSSSYWKNDTGTFQNGFLNWKRLGKGKIFYTHIDYGNGNIWHRDNRLDRYFCDFFINKQIKKNKKGTNFEKRFIDILSDPNNLLIKRVKDAGKIIDDNYVIMHNGIKVSKNGYYGDFSKCLTLNYGCHEPAEERMFQEVLLDIQDNATMIELGSYWSFYSIWFNKRIKNAKNYCIEPDSNNMEVGIRNCKLNNVKVDFTQGFIGNNNIKISNFILEKNIDYIDILHSDIQGYELQLLEDIMPLLSAKKIKYIFVSTHSNALHYDCLELLKKCNYRIIASADFEKETFCFDGIIVACPEDNLTIKHTSLGCRKTTQLRNKPYKVDYVL